MVRTEVVIERNGKLETGALVYGVQAAAIYDETPGVYIGGPKAGRSGKYIGARQPGASLGSETRSLGGVQGGAVRGAGE